MSKTIKPIRTIFFIITLILPVLSYSREANNSKRNNLYSDDDIAIRSVDTKEAQIFLGMADTVASTYLFKSAFSLPNTIKIKQEMLNIATELDLKKIELEDAKKTVTKGNAKLMLKKKSLLNNINKEISRLEDITQKNKGLLAKILGRNGVKIRAIKLVGSTFFALDVLNRVIVWSLLNDFPGYILDTDDIKNIAFNLFGIGDWEIGEDDGSRAREM